MADNYAGLRRVARAVDAEPTPENEPDAPKGPKAEQKKEVTMTEEEKLAAAKAEGKSEALAEASAAANARYNTVLASEHYAGREKLAAKLLGNDKLDATEIVGMLAEAEKAAPVAADPETNRAAAEEAGRQTMKEALEENANSNIDANNGGGKPLDAKAKAAGVWDRANAKVGRAKPAA